MSQESWGSEVRARWQKYRWWYVGGLALAFAIICAGVIAGNNSENSSLQPRTAFKEPLPQQSSSAHRSQQASAPPKPRFHPQPKPKPTLTGLGAPLEVFQAHYPGAAAPLTEHGRVYGFEIYYLEAPISESEATAIASSAMPPDATLENESEKATCKQVVFRSETLASLFETPEVMAEFSSGANSAGPYSSSDITNILFLSYFGPIGC